MAVRFLTRLAAVFFALFILFASLLESSSIKYAFGARDTKNPKPSPKVDVVYDLPYPGEVLPGNPLWTAKALKDKLELELTRDYIGKSRLELHLADKRLAAGWKLWEQGNSAEALSTFDKAEKYLLSSYETLFSDSQPGNPELLRLLSYSSLKHREVLENVMSDCGDESRPLVSKMLGTSKTMYTNVSAKMNTLQMNPPENPF